MRRIRAWFARLAGEFQSRRAEESFAEEIESHLALHIEDNLRRGMSPTEARRVALLKLGGRDAVTEAWRDQRRLPFFGTVAQDARFALRTMRRSPGLTATAILTLALGIGANTAMFSVVYGVLLSPLPYSHPERLFYGTCEREGRSFAVSPPDFREMRDQNRTLQSLSAYYWATFNWGGDAQPEPLWGSVVSTGFFDTLGARPLLGRTLHSADGVWGAHREVILSEKLWRSHFGGRADILGSTTLLDGEPYTVIGVMPAGFYFPYDPELWTPMAWRPGDDHNSHANYFLQMVARPKDGVSRERALADLNAILAGIAARHPENKGIAAVLIPLGEHIFGDVSRSLWVLLAAVGFVLLLCAVNLSSLLLSRDTARRKEFALRSALGASRARLLRQFLTESILLAAIGGAAAVALAYFAVAQARTMALDLPRIAGISVNTPVLFFALAISLAAGTLSGLAPCWSNLRADLADTLREGGRIQSAGDGGRRRFRGALVTAEVALAFVLTIGAGLMTESFSRLMKVNLGFNPQNVLAFQISLPASYTAPTAPDEQVTPPRLTAFYDEFVARLSRLPGVDSAGVSSVLPLRGGYWTKYLSFDDRPVPPSIDQVATVQFRSTDGDYFRAIGMSLREGRSFDAGDNLRGRPVAIVNAALARQYYPNQDPIGKLIFLSPPESLIPPGELPKGFRFPRIRIVGVVNDARYGSLGKLSVPEVYAPLAQSDFLPTMSIAVRTHVPPLSLVPAIRAEAAAMDRSLPVDRVSTMEEVVGSSVALPRLHTLLLGGFGLLALGLAAIGLYGTIAQSVVERTHEVGVRIALGARPGSIVTGIVGRAMGLVTLGLIIGCALSLALTRLMATLLFGVRPTDLPTFVGAAGVLLLTSALASFLPARRAALVDPIQALRCE